MPATYTLAFSDPSELSVWAVTPQLTTLINKATAITKLTGLPTFSPTGDQVAYTGTFGSPSVILFTPDGGAVALEIRNDVDPNWSSGNELVCVADGGSVIDSFNPATSARAGVDAVQASSPTWDPGNAAQYAYLSGSTLMVQGDPLQSNSTVITVTTQVAAFSWSPTGDDLAFVTNESGSCGLEVSDVSSGTATAPVSVVAGLSCTAPSDVLAWSPDDASIAFTHGDSIYVVPAGSVGLNVAGLTPVLSLASPILQVGWTPDSSWTVFTDQPAAGQVQLGLVPPFGDGGVAFPLQGDGGAISVGLNGFAVSSH